MSVWRLTQVLVSYICAQVFLQRTTKRLASVREYCIEDDLVMAREGNLRRARRLRLVEERLVDTVAVLVILVQRLQANVVQNRVPLRQQFPQVFYADLAEPDKGLVEFRVVLLGFQANDAILHGNFQNDGDLRRVRNEMRDEFRERFIQGRIVDVLRMIVAPPWQRLYP